MPRVHRIDVPGVPQHVVIRGHDRQPCFFEDMDRRVFLKYMAEAVGPKGCDLHAYVLMTNHVHLLVTAREPEALSRLMHSAARRYSAYVNRRRQRSGSLYEGRFRSTPIAGDRYFLACMRYIELNPVRAGMCANAAAFDWSSFRANASGAPAGLLTPHPVYQALGRGPEARAAAYLRLFREEESEALLSRFRKGVTPAPRGRPVKKEAPPPSEMNLVLF